MSSELQKAISMDVMHTKYINHVLFISDNFFPESNASANRLYDHARIWVQNGYQVTILTCAPNFPKGRVFNGYKNKWRQIEFINDIKVIRIKSFISPNQGSFKRIIDYMSFALHAAIQGLFVKKPDLVIGTSPQPFPIFSAWFVARAKQKPFIFELRDLWPESIVAVGAMAKKNVLLNFFGRAIKRMYRSANVIVSVTDSFKNILIQNEKIDPYKIVVCKNGIKLDAVKPTEDPFSLRQQYNVENKYLVGYIGTIGMAHSIETIIEAAKLSTDLNVHFVIMGTGSSAEDIKEQSKSFSNVTFIENGTRQDAINISNMLDAYIVHLKNTPLFSTVIPSKIFEAMALGKPILIGVKGEAKDIVEQGKAGIEFEPQNARSLNAAIQRIQQIKFENYKIKDFVERQFNRDQIALNMLHEIELRLNQRL